MRQNTIPAEFSSIAHLVSYVVKRTPNEWSSSCPKCGGTVHKNGEEPDRFRMFLNAHGMNKVFGWCRACNYVWFPGEKPSKEQVETWKAQQKEVEEARRVSAERALAHLNNDKEWERFYDNNNEWSRQMYRDRGISDSWIDYLKLGLMPDYTVKCGDGAYHSPAHTIPLWNVGGVVQNIKLRVLNPKTGADRYRNFYSMGQSFPFIPLYDLPLTGAGVIVEGEFKAIVMEQKLNNPSFRVVGVGSKTPGSAIFAQMKDLDPVYVFLDPDAKEKEKESSESAVEYVARLVGKERARIVDCPVKCDDGIVKYGLEPMSYIRMAKKAQ